MGVRILKDERMAALYCSTTDIAFGPVFYGDGKHDAEERAEAFLRWLPEDARRIPEADLLVRYSQWRGQEAAQYIREES